MPDGYFHIRFLHFLEEFLVILLYYNLWPPHDLIWLQFRGLRCNDKTIINGSFFLISFFQRFFKHTFLYTWFLFSHCMTTKTKCILWSIIRINSLFSLIFKMLILNYWFLPRRKLLTHLQKNKWHDHSWTVDTCRCKQEAESYSLRCKEVSGVSSHHYYLIVGEVCEIHTVSHEHMPWVELRGLDSNRSTENWSAIILFYSTGGRIQQAINKCKFAKPATSSWKCYCRLRRHMLS